MSGAVETIRRAIWKFVSEQDEAAQSQSLFAFLSNRDDLLAEAVAAALTAPPARTYAEGVEDAAKAVEALRREVPYEYNRHPCSETKRRAIAAIRLLSQGEKA